MIVTSDAVKYSTQRVRKAEKKSIPLLSKQFVLDCVKEKTLQDMSKYIINETSNM